MQVTPALMHVLQWRSAGVVISCNYVPQLVFHNILHDDAVNQGHEERFELGNSRRSIFNQLFRAFVLHSGPCDCYIDLDWSGVRVSGKNEDQNCRISAIECLVACID